MSNIKINTNVFVPGHKTSFENIDRLFKTVETVLYRQIDETQKQLKPLFIEDRFLNSIFDNLYEQWSNINHEKLKMLYLNGNTGNLINGLGLMKSSLERMLRRNVINEETLHDYEEGYKLIYNINSNGGVLVKKYIDTQMKVVELKSLCKELGIKGYSKYKKDMLITIINDHLDL